jgi:hypothetical protein
MSAGVVNASQTDAGAALIVIEAVLRKSVIRSRW